MVLLCLLGVFVVCCISDCFGILWLRCLDFEYSCGVFRFVACIGLRLFACFFGPSAGLFVLI